MTATRKTIAAAAIVLFALTLRDHQACSDPRFARLGGRERQRASSFG